jgi:hypothetical protein
MKNAEKLVRSTAWHGPGLVKKMDSWRKWEKPEEKEVPLNPGPTEPSAKKFRKWNMPDQSEGYIKSKRHDFL